MLELGINIYKAAAMPASQPGADRTAMEGRMTEMQRENSKATQQLAGDADQVHSVICIHHDGYECLVVMGPCWKSSAKQSDRDRGSVPLPRGPASLQLDFWSFGRGGSGTQQRGLGRAKLRRGKHQQTQTYVKELCFLS